MTLHALRRVKNVCNIKTELSSKWEDESLSSANQNKPLHTGKTKALAGPARRGIKTGRAAEWRLDLSNPVDIVTFLKLYGYLLTHRRLLLHV